jgi:hypothetical protein
MLHAITNNACKHAVLVLYLLFMAAGRLTLLLSLLVLHILS